MEHTVWLHVTVETLLNTSRVAEVISKQEQQVSKTMVYIPG